MNSKRKGDTGELELLHSLEARGIPCHRNQQGLLADFRGGRGNPDIWMQLDRTDFHVEVKRTERFALYPSLQQAQRDALPPMIPVVIHRQSRKPWVVVMTLDDFLSIQKRQG